MVKDCNEYDKGCKYFHHEPYYTPNNYDVFFDYNSIPVNIPVEKPHDFRNRLQKLMPLTKIIHLNMDSETFKEDNNIHLHTKLKLNYNTLEKSTQTQLKITGEWDESLNETMTSDVTYKLYYLYEEESPINNAKIKLINSHYPLKQYSGTSNMDGICIFEDLPYGSYVQQILLDGYSIPLQLISVDEDEMENKILIAASEEIDEDDIENPEEGLQLNFYRNGILILSSWFYENGTAMTADEIRFEDGVLTLDVASDDYDDSTTILINTPGFDEVNDFTEFKVDIIADNEIVETVALNFRNNYTKTSHILPLYDEDDNLIDYSISYSQENCNVEVEYLNLVKYKNNEVVLL